MSTRRLFLRGALGGAALTATHTALAAERVRPGSLLEREDLFHLELERAARSPAKNLLPTRRPLLSRCFEPVLVSESQREDVRSHLRYDGQERKHISAAINGSDRSLPRPAS